MTSSLALALWLATAGQLPIATQAQLPTGETAELAAEQLLYEPGKQILTLRGNTLLRTDTMMVRADELIYDQREQKATARGNVMMIAAGNIAAVADEVQVDIKSLEATVRGGLFMQKRNVETAQLYAAKTPAELKELGETAALIRGTRIRRTGDNRFTVEDLSFTPCDCKPWEPSWRVEASSADVELGESADLWWPRVYVYELPVFALPWLQLPLTDRRAGLLVPRPHTGTLTGIGVEAPVFVTLGESYDLTFTPAYFFGTTRYDEALGRRVQNPHGVKGPRLHTELRYAPAEGTRGRVGLGLLYDLWAKRDPIEPWVPLPSGERRGLRGELALQHLQDLGHGWSDRVDLSMVSDAYYPKDLQADVLLREVQYLRSTAAVVHRGQDHYLGLDVALRQDLRDWGFNFFRRDTDAFGRTLEGPNTLQRLPALTFGLPDRPVAGPLVAGGTAELSRVAPWRLGFGDEGTDGIFDRATLLCGRPGATVSPTGVPCSELPPGQGDGVFQPGERQGRWRLDLRPRLSAPISLGAFARVTPYAAYRQDVYLGEYDGGFGHRGYPMAGVLAQTELSRTFGPSLRHAIAPSAEVRFVPAVFGAPLGLYDELDTAVAGGAGFLQAQTVVGQRLWLKNGAAIRELGRLDLGQTYDLGWGGTPARLGDTWAAFGTSLDRVSLDALARYNLTEQRLTQVTATLGVNDGRGDAAYVRYENLVTDGPERLRRGIDALVGPPTDPAVPRERAQTLVAGGNVAFGFGLGVRYEAVVVPGYRNPDPKRSQSPLAQQSVGVSYGPACDCWRLDLGATFARDLDQPIFGGNLSLGRFGSFGR